MTNDNLVWVKNGGSVKRVTPAKAKKLIADGYKQGTFNKDGDFVQADETAAKKANTVLKGENKKLATKVVALETELAALKAKTPA